nr:26S proteasome non-ATPase regulatory subunit 1 homolog A-like [Tanacetum cinerariifolium]
MLVSFINVILWFCAISLLLQLLFYTSIVNLNSQVGDNHKVLWTCRFVGTHRPGLLILKRTKESIEMRDSIFHSATIYANALMHVGTTVDIFLRENMRTKESIEMRDSIFHSATIYANALMHVGTTVDIFLRENMDWLSKATNWAKFCATTGLGVIHRGHLKQGDY